MAQIPLYEQHTAPTQGPSAPAPDLSAPFQALQQFGGVAADVAFDYVERRKDLKEKADRSDYNVELKNLETTIMEAKSDASQKGVGYQEMYGEVVTPLMNEFNERLERRGYSKSSLRDIRERWALDSATITQGEANEREQMELLDFSTRVRDDAFSMINDGDTEGGMELLDSVEGIVGADRVSEWKSLGVYNRNLNEMNSMTNPKDIKAFIDSDEAKKMNPGQYQQFRSLGESRVRKLTSEEFAPAKKELNSLHKRGELTVDAIQSYGLPENEERLMIKMLDDDIQESYTENKLVIDELYGEVDTFLSGKYRGSSDEQYDNLLTKIEEAELPASIKFDVLLPVIEGQGSTSLNAPFFISKKKQEVYDPATSVVLNLYRDSFNSAHAGETATSKMYGFGNGYRAVQKWIIENKGDFRDGRIPQEAYDVVQEAVRPVVTNRIRLNQQKANNSLRGTPNIKEETEDLDAFWSTLEGE